jgi:hypothetical protein
LVGRSGPSGDPGSVRPAINFCRVRLHRRLRGHHRRERFVIDLDEAQRLLGDMRTGRGDRGDRMAVVQHLAARHHVERQVMRVDHQLAHHRGGARDVGQVGAGDYGLDAGKCRGFFGANRD